MNRQELIDELTAKILTGGNRTKAVDVRKVLTDILNNCWVIEDPVTYFIIRSTGPGGHRFKVTMDDTGMPQFPGEDLGV